MNPSPERSRARDREAPRRRARRSIDVEVLLLVLPLLVAVPLLGYGAFLLYVTAERAEDHARREQAAAQGALQAALVGELRHAQESLAVFAASLAPGGAAVQAEGAAAHAERVVRAGLGIRGVAVLDANGAVVAEYPPRGGAPRVVRLEPHQARVFETGAPAVSDLHESPVDGRLSVSIDVPVKRGGRVRWIVTALLDPDHLTEVLSAQVGARDAVSTVLDARRRIVARTRELARWYGESPSRETLEAADSAAEGWARFRTRDGNMYLWTWSTTPEGWTVWLGSPARERDEALRASLLRLGSVGVLVLVSAMGATALLARRIAASVDRMAENAQRLTGGEHPPYRPSGIRQLDALYRALEDANDRVSRALEDRDRALQAERSARSAADAQSRSKDLFLGMLSHELRNPLAPIRSSVYVLQHADPASDAARRARAVIERQTEHLTRIVDDLLDVTRIERGKILLRRARVDLRDVVRRTVEDGRADVEHRGVRLDLELPEEPLWADADPTRVTQTLGNLLHNAAKFTKGGDEIRVTLRRVDGAAELRVRDTGAGIDPELLPHLFDPFVQGKRTLARSEGGLGLGLALVKGLVELHGGTVRARSEGAGKGAEFAVVLPLQGDAAAERAAEARPAPAAERRRVLVVDDNGDAADSLAAFVGLFGHEVEIAYDGPSAIEKARRRRPDVVFCDIGLPGMTGYEVARTLRAEHDGALRLVAVSGYARPEDIDRATEAGFDAHLAKPPDPERLASFLRVGG